jgi:hypothetical protein
MLLIIAAYGCGPKRSYSQEDDQAEFIPPTLVPTATATLPPTETISPEKATQTASCSDILKYISDLTIPDGTEVAPRATMDKRWEVENAGTCNWDANYRIKRISGDVMGVTEEMALYPALSGTMATIRILFTAPDDPGIHRSAWQAVNPQGQPFGDPVYIEIVVQERTMPTP